MPNLRLEELLRYTLSGGLFLVAVLLSSPFLHQISWTTAGFGDTTKSLGLVLLVGALIYSFHRAVVFPLVLFPIALTFPAIFGAYKFERKFWIPFHVSNVEKRLDDDRFGLRERKTVLFEVWSEWGAQVHFLYCSSQAILLALFIGRLSHRSEHSRLLAVVAASLLAAGLVSQISLVYRATVVWKDAIREGLSKIPPNSNPPSS